MWQNTSNLGRHFGKVLPPLTGSVVHYEARDCHHISEARFETFSPKHCRNCQISTSSLNVTLMVIDGYTEGECIIPFEIWVMNIWRNFVHHHHHPHRCQLLLHLRVLDRCSGSLIESSARWYGVCVCADKLGGSRYPIESIHSYWNHFLPRGLRTHGCVT